MITVALSVYNNGRYLSKAMDSLLSQTYRDFEIILVDDGSTDDSNVICDSQGKRSDNIRVIHKPNGGLSSARNLAIEEAQGEFIIFPDPDDWVEPNYLEELMAIKTRTGADLSICGHFDEMDGKTRIWNAEASPCVLDNGAAMELLMLPNSFCGYAWNKLYRLDVIRSNNLRFDLQLGMAQDLHFAVRYFQCIRTVAYDPVPLYHYNHDSGGVTASYSPLTKRKMSSLLTYRLIGEMTAEKYPKIMALAHSSLCHMCLQYIYIYYRSGMKDKNTLAQLTEHYKKYRSYYAESSAYTKRDKMFMNVVPFSPRLYAFLTRLKKYWFYLVDKKRKAAWKPAA